MINTIVTIVMKAVQETCLYSIIHNLNAYTVADLVRVVSPVHSQTWPPAANFPPGTESSRVLPVQKCKCYAKCNQKS